MEALGLGVGAIAALVLAYVIGHRNATQRASRIWGVRVTGLEAEVKRLARDLTRLDTAALQWAPSSVNETAAGHEQHTRAQFARTCVRCASEDGFDIARSRINTRSPS